MIGYVYAVLFILTIPAANWLIGNVGTECISNGPCLIPVGFGLHAPSGVLMIGAALVLRDAVHERFGSWASVGLIIVGSVLSWIIADPYVAIASAVAFLVSEMADLIVYVPIRKRSRWAAIVASGVAGSIIDSALFLWIAFGSLQYIEGQIVGKIAVSALAAAIIYARTDKLVEP